MMKIYVLMLFLPLGCNLSDAPVSNLGQGEKQDTGPSGEDVIADIPGLLASDVSADVQDMNTVQDGGVLTDVAPDLPTPPAVIQVAPLVDLDPLDSVHVFFDKEMNDESLTAEKVRFLTSASDDISTTLDYSPMPSDLQVAFQSRLNLLAAYRLTLDGAIEDLEGNNLEPGEWDIQTRDGQWRNESNIDRVTKKAFSPQVLAHEKYGMVIYRQISTNTTTSDLLASVYDWDTKVWSKPLLLEAGSGSVPIFKSEQDSNGNITVIWSQRQGLLGSNLYQKRFDAKQLVWGPTTVLEDNGGVTDFNLESTPKGDVIAVWARTIGGMWTRRFDIARNVWSTKFELARRNIQSKIHIADDGKGNILLIFLTRNAIGSIPVEQNLFSKRYNTTTQKWESAVGLDTENGNPSSVQLSMNDQGDATVIWVLSKKVWVKQYNARNAVWGPRQSLSTNPSLKTQVIASEKGGFFAFWIDALTDKVLTSTFDGLDWSTAQALDSGSGMVESFTLGKASDGNLFLVSVQKEGALKKIWTTYFDLSKAQWIPAVQISSQPLTGRFIEFAVKADREGNMMAFWRQSESEANLWSNRFDARQQSWKNSLKLNKNMGTVGEFSFDSDSFGRGILSFRQSNSGELDITSKVFD